MRIIAFLLAVLAVTIPSGSVAGPNIYVFVLAGQSNMVGRGQPISDGTGPVDPNLLLFRDGAWEVAQDPLGPSNDSRRGVGPGMTFGLGILSHEPTGTIVGLVMCARGATSISVWLPGHSRYEACKREARAAGGSVAGLVFLQGEYEAHTSGGASHWLQRFKVVEDAFEKDFGPVPFVLGQIGNIDQPFAQQVRDAQAEAAAELPSVTLVPSIDLLLQPDGHFKVDSYKTLGGRFADAWWSLNQAFPRVSGVSQAEGQPGTSVILTGTAFDNVTGITFGGASASFAHDGPGQLTAIVPDDGRTGRIGVISPYGTLTGPAFAVQPVIDSFSPESGRPGMKVFVSGKSLAGATAATVGGQRTSIKVLSATQVRVKVPKGAASGAISVTTAGGTAESVGVFTVLP